MCKKVPFQVCKDREECHDVEKKVCTKVPVEKCDPPPVCEGGTDSGSHTDKVRSSPAMISPGLAFLMLRILTRACSVLQHDHSFCGGSVTPKAKCHTDYKEECKPVKAKVCKTVQDCHTDYKDECKKVGTKLVLLVHDSSS